MAALSTTLRCQNCGFRLGDDDKVECPNCGSQFSEVGVWSELLEWQETRRQGPSAYVWRHALADALLTTVAAVLGLYLLGRPDWQYVMWVAAMNLVSAHIFRRWYWRAAERQYHDAVDEGFLERQR